MRFKSFEMRRKDKAIMNPQMTQIMEISSRDPRTYAIIGAAMEESCPNKPGHL